MNKFKSNIKLFIYTIRLLCKINKKIFAFSVLLSIINGVFPIATLLLSQRIINEIQLLKRPFSILLQFIIIYFAISGIGTVLQNINGYVLSKLNNILQYGINKIIIEKCSKLSLETLERTETYDTIARLEQDIATKPYQTLQAIMSIFSNGVSAVLASVIIISWNVWVEIILLIISISMFMGEIFIGNKEFIMKYKRSDKERESWYYSYLLTHDTAFKEIKSYGLKNHFINKYIELSNIFISQSNQIEKFKTILNISIALIQDVFSLVTMIMAIHAAYIGSIMIGTAMSFLNAINMVQGSTNALASGIYTIYNSNLYIRLLEEFLDNSEGEEELDSDTKLNLERICSLELSGVGYDYPEFKDVLRNVTLRLDIGEQIAIVGKNGSGKSTLFKIICGLYKTSRGEFFVNGQDINECNVESYRKRTSVLFQDFLKFEGSLEENIVIGDINNQSNTEEIYMALDKANVNFLKSNGYYDLDKTLGNWFDNGSQLSGGQWQKIALARAYYRKADVILLDEPSSALDAMAEMKIFKSFFEISKDKIGIYITHRVKIAKNATKIVVIEGGEIVGIGNHEGLMQNCSVYRDMYCEELKDIND
ncbi:MAG: ABC transporter ATP-binding protein [Clostridiales bacterium]|jgi:ABC-type multidrug transport system fused ATPase/permease subunit|uniref:ABC transporter ATP-binding protein n=1 Tax=Lacrimispora sp. TaxID=2719234 RepID=UPI0028A5C9F4|nr:ABC transporter ATP-binding protein [Lacrimispora sp.]MBS5958299.1 ABC transporter ATP-binding protein [Clostridiales bacterium]